jgi:hypothetical protein
MGMRLIGVICYLGFAVLTGLLVWASHEFKSPR